MRINLKGILLFILLFIVSFCYSYFFHPFFNDEIWSYGFAYNIFSGLIPYRDFNMVITPLYPFILSFFIFVFGHHLFVLHIFNSILLSFIIYFFLFRLKQKSIFIIPLLLFYAFPGYNFWCLFLFFVILIYIDKCNKHVDLILGFLVSCLFLSKQSIGLCLLLPLLFYSKNRLKALICFMIPICLFLVYLFYNHVFYDFINYCFLGLFEFNGQNRILLFLPFEMIVIGILVCFLFKSKFKDKQAFYILMFQIVVFPIMDDFHFFMGFIPFLYFILEKYSFQFILGYKFKYFFTIVAFSFIFWNYMLFFNNRLVLFTDSSSYLYGRVMYDYVSYDISYLSNYVKDVRNKYDYVFLLTQNSYVIKLNIGDDINEFDLINNGNMGYDGVNRYISKLEDMCLDNSCLFFLNLYEFGVDGKSGGQTNKDILEYIHLNFDRIDSIDKVGFELYSNKKE